MKHKTLVILCALLLLCLHLSLGAPKAEAASLKAPTLNSISCTTYGVKITWKKVAGAAGYRILRKTSSSAGFTTLATLSGPRSSYTDTKAISGATVTYTVRAYTETNGKKSMGSYNKTGLSITYVPAPTLTSVKDTENGLKIYWNKVEGATAYTIYRKEGNGSYSKLKKIKTGTTVKYTDKTALLGHSYSYTIRAFIGSHYGDKGNSLSATHTMTSFEAEVPVVHRALLIGECAYFPRSFNLRYPDYDHAENLYAPYYDVRVLRYMLKDSGYQVKLMDNPTKSQILDAIQSYFSSATSNDICLFYYSGHGVSDRAANTGALVIPKGNGSSEYFTLQELAGALNQIPSRMIVMLDSCGSGAAILSNGFSSASVSGDGLVAEEGGELLTEDELETDTLTESFDPLAFNHQVLSAFFGNGNHTSKTGEFLQEEKYYVLTSSRTWQNSAILALSNTIHASLMTIGVVEGAGYSYFSSVWNGLLPADKNEDNAISLEEAYSYAYKIALGLSQNSSSVQNVQRYPYYSPFILYERKN